MRTTVRLLRRAGAALVVIAGIVLTTVLVTVLVSVLVSVVAAVVTTHGAAIAADHSLWVAPPTDLNHVIQNIRAWLFGLLVSLATLFLTIGGIRYLLAGGDPGEVAKAKDTLKYAAIGYAVAVLAPVLVTILKGFVGGG
jgi:hypothetical protein